MTNVSFDLVDMIRTIQQKKRFILLMTICALLLGVVFLLIRHTKYKASAGFFVNNPLYGDRSTMFRTRDTKYVDYFAGDDDVDKIMALAAADTVRDRIIRNCQFQDVYKQDINTPKGHAMLMSTFNKNFSIKRTEYKDIEVTYIAYDAQTAANVANTTVKVLEEIFRNYFTYMKNSINISINEKLVQIDSSINIFTDSLANMRDRYGIYSIISPVRQNMVSSEIKGGGKGFGMAIEQIQNIEAVKDQLVADRAHYISALNEFAASANDHMDYLKVITRATPPISPTGPSVSMVLGVAAALGLLFSTAFALVMGYYNKIKALI